jgi:hypothetical protein
VLWAKLAMPPTCGIEVVNPPIASAAGQRCPTGSFSVHGPPKASEPLEVLSFRAMVLFITVGPTVSSNDSPPP